MRSTPQALDLHTFSLYIRREAALKWGAWGLVGGLGIAVLLALVAWTFPVLTLPPRIALSLVAIASVSLLFFLAAYLYPRPLMTVARLSDARMRLRARLATALEIQEGKLPVPRQIADRQWNDAHAAAQSADPRKAFALRFPRRQALVAAALLALLATSFLLPNPQEARIAQRQAEQAAIAKQVERLEKLRDEIAADADLDPETKEELLREIDDAIHDLKEGDLSKEEAVARLSETEQKLQDLLQDTDAQASDLREAGREAAQGEHTQEVGQALEQDDYSGAAEAIESLGEQLPHMSAAELQDTARRLEAMADAVAATNPELAQALRDAASAMRQGNVQAAQEALDRAAALTEQAGQQITGQSATEQALGQIQEGRREIAQTGQQGPGAEQQGQGPGQPGSGEGQPGDVQEGQGQQGQGQQGGGSGDQDSSGQGGQGTPGAPGDPIQPNQPGGEGETPYDPIYVPDRPGGEGGERIDLPGEGEGGPPTGEREGSPEEGETLVPYNEVYTDYQAQAASALENSYIPRGIKDYVRSYFDALEPGD